MQPFGEPRDSRIAHELFEEWLRRKGATLSRAGKNLLGSKLGAVNTPWTEETHLLPHPRGVQGWVARKRPLAADRSMAEPELRAFLGRRQPAADHDRLVAEFLSFDWGYGSWGDREGSLVLGLPLLIPSRRLARRWAAILDQHSWYWLEGRGAEVRVRPAPTPRARL